MLWLVGLTDLPKLRDGPTADPTLINPDGQSFYWGGVPTRRALILPVLAKSVGTFSSSGIDLQPLIAAVLTSDSLSGAVAPATRRRDHDHADVVWPVRGFVRRPKICHPFANRR